MSSKSPELSLVIPVLNEEPNLAELLLRLSGTLAGLAMDYEIIFVDDGSTDGTLEALRRLRQEYQGIKVLVLSRNFGHQVALCAGLEFASGRAVITMDGDLQHPPELIPQMVAQWQQGGEVVNTVRRQTKDAGFFKRFTSRCFYRLLEKTGGISLGEGAADFRLLDRKVVNVLNQLTEHRRFLRGLVSWTGFRIAEVPYDAPSRFAGDSRYSLRRMASLAVDGIVSFSLLPLYLAFFAAVLVFSLTAVYLAIVLYVRLATDQAIPGWASILASVLSLGGLQLLIMGIIGLYIGRVFDEVRNRPYYVIRQRVGWDEDN